VQGKIVTLPAGELRFRLGCGLPRQRVSTIIPDQGLITNDSFSYDNHTFPTSGTQNVRESIRGIARAGAQKTCRSSRSCPARSRAPGRSLSTMASGRRQYLGKPILTWKAGLERSRFRGGLREKLIRAPSLG